MKRRICAALFLSLLLSAAACSRSANRTTSQQPGVPASGELRFKAPDGWITEKTLPRCAPRSTSCQRRKGIQKMLPWCSIFWRGAGRFSRPTLIAGSDRCNSPMVLLPRTKHEPKPDSKRIESNCGRCVRTYTAEMTPGTGDRHNSVTIVCVPP